MTGQVAKMSTYSQGFSGGLTVRGLPVMQTHPGKVYYVGDSTIPSYPNRKAGSDSAANKGEFLSPYASLDHAIEQCTDDRGDIVFVLPNHSETLSTQVAADVSDLAIVGLGNGVNRPNFTNGVGDNAINVSADDVLISNLYFNEATAEDADGGDILISASNTVVEKCHFDAGANDELKIVIDATGEVPTIKDNKFVVTADAPDTFISVTGVVDQPTIVRNVFVADDGTNALDDGVCVNYEGNAVTNIYHEDNVVLNRAGGVTEVGGLSSASGVTIVPQKVGAVENRIAQKHGLLFDGAEQAVAETDNGDVLITGMVMTVQGGAETGVEAVFDNVTTTSSGNLYGAAQETVIEVGDGLAVGESLFLTAGAPVDGAEADQEDLVGTNFLVTADDNIVWDAAGASTADGVGHLTIMYQSINGGELEIE